MPILAFTLLLTKLQDSFPTEVKTAVKLLLALKNTFSNGRVCHGGWPYKLLDFITSYSKASVSITHVWWNASTTAEWLSTGAASSG